MGHLSSFKFCLPRGTWTKSLALSLRVVGVERSSLGLGASRVNSFAFAHAPGVHTPAELKDTVIKS